MGFVFSSVSVVFDVVVFDVGGAGGCLLLFCFVFV